MSVEKSKFLIPCPPSHPKLSTKREGKRERKKEKQEQEQEHLINEERVRLLHYLSSSTLYRPKFST